MGCYFNTDIFGLIVKWEGIGGEGSSEEGGGGGVSHIGRRKSTDFISKLSVFEYQKAEVPISVENSAHSSFSSLTHNNVVSESKSISKQSHRMRGSLLLVEGKANEKRGRVDSEVGSRTKRSRRT